MGRRWNGNQYTARYIRRLERREFNKEWDNINHPASPDGSRRCVDCAKNGNCNLNRKGNHAACFSRIMPERNSEEESNSASGTVAIILIVFVICGIIALCISNSMIYCIVLGVFIFLALCAGK